MQCCLYYSVLKGFDIFGTQVNLSYKKDSQFRTVFGGFMTLFCIVIVTILCFSNSTLYETAPSTLEIGVNTAMIAIKYDQTNFIGRPMFNITFYQSHYHRFPNSTVNSTKVGGVYNNDDFYYIKFSISKCINSTNTGNLNLPWNPVCENPTVTQASITSSSRIRLIISNNVLNPERAQGSLTSFLDSAIYNVQPNSMYTTANIYLNSQKLVTDESIVPISSTHTEELIQYKSSDTISQNAVGSFPNFCEIYFQRSTYSTIAQKSYLKLNQVISYIGGFCQIFFLISAFIVSKHNSLVLYNELANRLYDFEVKSNQNISIQNNSVYQNRQSMNNQPSNQIFTTNQNELPNNLQKIVEKQDSEYSDNDQDSKYNNVNNKSCNEQNNNINNDNNDGEINKTYEIQNQSTSFTPNQCEQIGFNQTIINMSQIETPSNDNSNILNNNIKRRIQKFQAKKKRQLNSSSIISDLEQKQQNNESLYDNQLYLNQPNQQQSTPQNNLKMQNKFIEVIKSQSIDDGSVYYGKNSHKVSPLITSNKENGLTKSSGVNSKQLKQSEQRIGDAKQYLEQELKALIQKDRSVWVSFKYVLNELTCGKFFNTPEVKLFHKAIAYLNEDLDIFTILDRQKEVEKMKKLLFNEDQQVLFNFFPKPVIKLSQDRVILCRKQLNQSDQPIIQKDKTEFKKLNISIKQMNTVFKAVTRFKNGRKSGISNYQRLFQHYQKLTKQSRQRDQEGVMNKKLIDLLGEEMKNIFEVTNEYYQKLLYTQIIHNKDFIKNRMYDTKKNRNNLSKEEFQKKSFSGLISNTEGTPFKTNTNIQFTANEYCLNETIPNYQDNIICQRNAEEGEEDKQYNILSNQDQVEES